MTDERDCGYCDSSFRTDEALVDHLAASHDREQLSRVDRKRVETHADGTSGSRLGTVTPDGRLSRRATLVAAGTVLAGIGIGIGRRVTQSAEQIQDWNDLYDVRNDPSGDYVLANGLDENTAGYDNRVGNPTSGWDPIGDGGSPFTGTFDGQGNEIRGLEIDAPSDVNAGLFGRIGSGAQVQQLSVTNATVTGDGLGGPSGPGVGVLAGGTDGGTITDCLVSGAVKTTGDLGGGLVGNVDSGTIDRAVANVAVNGSDGGTGGFAGTVAVGSSIADSYALGDVNGGSLLTGGFIGELYGGGGPTPTLEGEYTDEAESDPSNDDTPDTPDTPGEDLTASGTSVATSYSAGSVTGGTSTGGFVGGGDDTEVTDCYWDEESSGQIGSAGGTGLTTSEMQGSEAVGNMTGFDFTTTWQTVDGDDASFGADGYPILTALDEGFQLALQGVLPAAVVVEGNDVTFDNVTVKRGDN